MLEILPQLIVNGLIASAIYMLISSGLTLVYGTLKFINLAHGELAAAGAYSFFVFSLLFKWPLIPSIVFALISTAVISYAIQKIAYVRVLNSPPLIPLILSVGVGILFRSLFQLLFGPESISIRQQATVESYSFGGVSLTSIQIMIPIVTIILIAALYLFLHRTKTGKAIRAVSDNKEVAAILGIDVQKVITVIFTLGSLLAAVAGILIGLDSSVSPDMGFAPGVKAFAVIILGGIGSLSGAIIGSLIIGLSENILTGITIAGVSIPSGYKDAIAFLILIIVLLIRPAGLMGRAEESVKH